MYKIFFVDLCPDLWWCLCHKEVRHMAKLTVEEVYRGDKYSMMGNAFKELMSLCEGIGTLDDLQTATKLLMCKNTLIAAKKMIEERFRFRISCMNICWNLKKSRQCIEKCSSQVTTEKMMILYV